MKKDTEPLPRSMRTVTIIAGLFFVAVGVVVLLVMDASNRTGSLIVAAVLIALGAEALFSSARNRRAWLMRIGPLP